MNSRRNLILLTVLFILVTWAVYLNKRPPAKEKRIPSAKILVGHTAGQVSCVILYNPKEYITLEKRGPGWQIISPSNMQADPAKVLGFLTHIFGLYYIRHLTGSLGDLSSFQLKERTTFVILAYINQDTDTLFLGGNTPKGNWYLQRNSDTAVYTVNREFGSMVHRSVKEWRMRRIADLGSHDIQVFEIVHGQGKLRFEKDTSTFAWQITHPGTWPGDHTRIAELLDQVLETEADQVIEHPASLHMPAPSKLRVRLQSLRGNQVEFQVASQKPGRYWVKRKDWPEALVMPDAFNKALETDWNELRDRSLFQKKTQPEQINRIVVTSDTSQVQIVKQGPFNWEFKIPFKGEKADTAVISEILDRVSKLKALSVYDKAPAELTNAKDLFQIQLQMMEGSKILANATFYLKEEVAFAKVENTYFKIDRENLHGILEEPLYYKQ